MAGGRWTVAAEPRPSAPRAAAAPERLPSAPIFQQLHGSATAGFVVGKFGVVTAYGSGIAPDWSGYADFGSRDLLSDIALTGPDGTTPTTQPVSQGAMAAYQSWANPRGGVILDGWGGIHPFGGMPLDTSGAPYWHGWDIARAEVVRPDGSGGWVLDAYGGIHAFGAAPAVHSPGSWPTWNIARAMVVTSRDSDGMPDGRQGYLLDGLGGVRPWGGAPALNGAPYTPTDDRWRGLEIHPSVAGVPDGGGRWTGSGGSPPLAPPRP